VRHEIDRSCAMELFRFVNGFVCPKCKCYVFSDRSISLLVGRMITKNWFRHEVRTIHFVRIVRDFIGGRIYVISEIQNTNRLKFHDGCFKTLIFGMTS
jgi:hypothetical protein